MIKRTSNNPKPKPKTKAKAAPKAYRKQKGGNNLAEGPAIDAGIGFSAQPMPSNDYRLCPFSPSSFGGAKKKTTKK